MANEPQVLSFSKFEKDYGMQLKARINGMSAMLEGVMTPEKFAALVINAGRRNDSLVQAIYNNPESFWVSIYTAAQLGLEPNGPLKQAYLIPYGGQVQLQIGYQGMLALARRDPNFKRVIARCVTTEEMEAGLFEFQEEPPILRHAFKAGVKRDLEIESKLPTNLAGAYAKVEMKDGSVYQMFLDKAQLDARRWRSAAKFGNFWVNDAAAMYRKTALRALLGSGEVPLDGMTRTAVSLDQAGDGEDGEFIQAAKGVIEVPTSPPKDSPKVLGAQEFGADPEDGFGERGQEIPLEPGGEVEHFAGDPADIEPGLYDEGGR